MKLPLFPLNTVLFPGCTLDLQIFEARYLDMISRCMRQHSGFGVVCLVEGHEVGPAASRFSAIGCEAHVRDFEQRANGLLGIRVEGGRRFRVEQASVLPDQLALAEVTWLDELPDRALLAEHADLAALLAALAQHPSVAELGMPGLAHSQHSLANQLAYLLPLEPAHKLELLAEADPGLRLEQLQARLSQLQGEA